MNIWGPLRSGMTKVSLLNGTDRCLSDWLNLFDWATGRLRLHKSFKGRRICKCEKRGWGKMMRKKIPSHLFRLQSTQSGAAFGGFIYHLKTAYLLPCYPCSFRSSAFHKNWEPGKSVNCQHHWLEGRTMMRLHWNQLLGSNKWQSFWFRPKSTPHYRSLHSFA